MLVTHEHLDHDAVEVVGGDPVVLRSTAGRLDSPVGEVVAVASEHDAAAGTERGPNTIFAFTLGGLRVAHFGDFGQRELRREQATALGTIDLLFVPVGGTATIDGARAAVIVERLRPRWAVPMHYRTARTNFLDPADDFLGRLPGVHHVATPSFDTSALPRDDARLRSSPPRPSGKMQTWASTSTTSHPRSCRPRRGPSRACARR